MKKFLLLAVLALVLTSCVSVQKKGSLGAVESANRQVDAFTAVRVEGAIDVEYEQGKDRSVTVSCPQSCLSRVETEVSDSVLIVRYNSGEKDILRDLNNLSIKVRVTSPDLVAVTVMGSGDFECEKPLDTDWLSLVLMGSGDIGFKSVTCDDLELVCKGSGDVKVDKADALRADVSLQGSGDVKVGLKNTRQTSVALVGSGDIVVDFDQCGVADSKLVGSGDITLSGTLGRLNQNVSGSGDMNTGRLKLGAAK